MKNIEIIYNIFEGAYIEELPNGLFVSTLPFFNPKHIWLPDKKSPTRSEQVAIMIAEQSRILATNTLTAQQTAL